MSREVSAPEVSRIGEVIDDRYEIVEHIADGGMASVFRAEQLNTRDSFAVKVLMPEFSGHREISLRFQREVRAYRSVHHPHMVSAVDFGRLADGSPYMVLEYIQGKDLYTLLREEKSLSAPRAIKIAREIAEVLDVAHKAHIVHRDLKPENIMLIERDGDKDFVKVVDFGIAKMQARDQAITAPGSIFGTPEYMAPEQARGADIDHRTDLYTLGVVLYEMLAGRTPFTGMRSDEIIFAQLKEPPPALPRKIDAELAELTLKLLAKEPNDRIQTASELVGSLTRIFDRLTSPKQTPPRSPEPNRAQSEQARRPQAPAQQPSPPTTSERAPALAETQRSSAWQVVALLVCVLLFAGLAAFLFVGKR